MSDPEKLPPIVYADSGKFLNDLGDYNNCQFHSDHYTYITMTVTNRAAALQQNMGLCCPKECAANVTSNMYSASIQSYLNDLFQNQTGSDVRPFVRLFFYDPVASAPQMDWTNYATMGFIVALIILALLASIIPRFVNSDTIGMKALKSFSAYDNLAKILHVPAHNEN